jgi:DNA-directed RNA polymerase specialized sigma24 family protein
MELSSPLVQINIVSSLYSRDMALSNEEQILKHLDQIRRILAVLLTNGLKQREQITALDRAGLPPREIADLLGTSSNTIRVELVALRKARRPRKHLER